MNHSLWPKPRVLALTALLTAALVAAGCSRTPQPLTAPANQSRQGGAHTPEPRQDLTFRYHGAGDGANTDGPTPTTSWTEFDVSDGSEVRAYQHSFKRPEYAEKFYLERIGGAGLVLQEGAQEDGLGVVTGRRAIMELTARGAGRGGAILELRGRFVSEVIGATVGHALAYEKWREQGR